jgi:cardiolipin synthase
MSTIHPRHLNHFTRHNRVRLVRGGKDYFDTLENIIQSATTSIYFQTYIFEADTTGNRVAQALMEAAQRGVNVFMLLDGYASQHLPGEWIRKLEAAGIFFRWFESIRSHHFYVGRRLHHKVVVVDAHHCLIGGINISDRYNDVDQPAWLDWAVLATGEVALSAYQICARRALTRWSNSKASDIPVPPVHEPLSDVCLARVLVNDWVRRKNEIADAYQHMLKTSQREIILMSSYFLPGRSFRKRMLAARRRNVQIKVMLTRISDVPLAKSAELYLYPWLLKNNIEIYEYTKVVLHGKITVCDRQWVSAGSFNLNDLSAKASVEMNLEIMDERFGTHVHETLSRIMESDCVRITQAEFANHQGWLKNLGRKMAYDLLRLILFLFTFYFKRERS